MTQNFTTGHLCAGVDGIGQGIGGTPVWFAENEPDPSTVLEREHPDVPNLGDIKAVNWESVTQPDVLTSGDPCQSISIAGRKAGRDDPRFLWPWVRDAYLRIEAPRIFFENVANMVSHDGGRTMAERFEQLRADGYAVRWTVFGACAVGAPHHRHRWYAYAEWVGGVAPEAVRVGGKTAICGAPRSSGRQLLASPKASDTSGAGVGRMADGKKAWHDLPSHVALLPSPAARDGDGRGEGSVEYWAARRVIRPEQGLPLGAEVRLLPSPGAGAASSEVWGRYAEAVALWEQITGVPAPAPTEPNSRGGVRLNPALPEWMMGYRPGYLTDALGRNAALKAAGNGVVPTAARAAWELLTT